MKKLLATGLSVVMAAMLLAGCATQTSAPASETPASEAPASEAPASEAPAAETVALRVWGAQDDQEMIQQMVDSFKAANTDKTYDITLGVMGEPDAGPAVLQDPAAAADVFSFPNDQLGDLVRAGALYEITGTFLDTINAEDTADSIAAGSQDGKLYAFPSTADNGYFMYYDKSVFTDTDIQTLDGMIAAAKAANKKIMIDIPNAWYLAGFFIGAGCNVITNADGTITCDWNNEAGQNVATAIREFANSGVYQAPGTSGDDTLTAGIGDTIAAGISGTWAGGAIQEKLGDNYGAAKLPTFTSGGQQVQMGSYSGYKFIGVSSSTQAPVDALKLAQWMTNQDNQVLRLTTKGYGPSNTVALTNDAVTSNPALVALAAQMPFAIVQNNVPGSFWTPAGALGTTLADPSNTDDVKTLLDQAVTAVVTPS